MTICPPERSPGFKLGLAIAIAFVLTIPLFSIYLLAYDRESQSREAAESITAGWGGPQAMTGPVLVIPYRATASETVIENGQSVTRSNEVTKELTLLPDGVTMGMRIFPEHRSRAIYQAVVYNARIAGDAVFTYPRELAHYGIDPKRIDWGRAELRFAISDPRGLAADSHVNVGTEQLPLEPGAGSSGGRGFFAWVDASNLGTQILAARFDIGLRGSGVLSFAPQAAHTSWSVWSPWPNPSFGGDFLPQQRQVDAKHFQATYNVGNLAIGRSLVSLADAGAPETPVALQANAPRSVNGAEEPRNGAPQTASISLIQPVDLYSQVNRAVKYGFLFIGFTFLALLMFDVIGGVRVSAVEYLLMGAALVLFFVLLLAFAEVIGFTPAYVLASAAIAGLNTAYSAAVLGSWRRAGYIGALLLGLYAVLYVLLSLEAYSLLIGSLLLFAALAGVMYATRRIDWGGRRDAAGA
jgi:inner membrane protein